MKKIFLYFILASFSFLIFSCSKKNSISESKIEEEVNVIAEEINTAAENAEAPAEENAEVPAEETEKPLKIDIDLTNASKTIIYATVFNMVVEPDDFIGKTVRVSGNFRVFEDDYSDERYYAIIIPDATACCETGIEFIWEGEHNYPEDYPAVEQKITITGKYNVMEFEDGVSYFYLDVSDIEF